MCPHHWDDGCECRKPKPGMLLAASKDFLFRLDKACFIGDDLRDIECAEAAGAFGILFKGDFNDDIRSLIKKYHS
jgi:D-glycero-D-manno-heptose 1,7-bisphosphate phosphatase